MSWERVRRPSEEGQCVNCGWPAYVGDSMWWEITEDGELCFCGRACAQENAQERREKTAGLLEW